MVSATFKSAPQGRARLCRSEGVPEALCGERVVEDRRHVSFRSSAIVDRSSSASLVVDYDAVGRLT
jgi:hypothetical protein